MKSIIHHFFEVPRWAKRLITLCCDLVFILLSIFGALFIRVGDTWVDWYSLELVLGSLIVVVGSIFVWVRLGLYRAVIRYIDVQVLSNILWGTLASALLMILTMFALDADIPRSVPFIYATLILVLVSGSRLFMRGMINAQYASQKRPVAIYGAGASGRQLCLALQNGIEFQPKLFVDDDAQLHRSSICDVKVFPPEKLEQLVREHDIEKVLIAIPSASNQRKRHIFNQLQGLGIEMLTIPGSADLVSGKVTISQLRSVEIQDLLLRDAIQPDMNLMGKCIKSKSVVVTGAGGSIGSELCRQILNEKPTRLILIDVSEFSLYKISGELEETQKNNGSSTQIISILGSVLDSELIGNVYKLYSVETVYHAAAYKHVPLVEHNVISGLRNNIWGTYNCATEALKCGVANFVLISTDKAVRPTNIMGASKRISELVLQALADEKSTKTNFSMVRFGNVLGSSGSVIPLFKKQIQNGGPVTVTHPDITRFFMTIPEAAQLVIQAGSMGNGGEVFVLDMGEPVKIHDLAVKMIHLSGLTVKSEDHIEGDIEITHSGLRPGEKLYEELLIGDNVEGTNHSRIMKARECYITLSKLNELVSELDSAMNKMEIKKIHDLLLDAPIGYNSETISDALWLIKKSGTVLKAVK